MVLITSKKSNILEDIDTLHLFAQVVASVCHGTLDERVISHHAFELLSAFDEIVTLGYCERLTLPQIKTILEMESHEEKIQEIISRVGIFEDLVTCRIKSTRQVKNGNAGPVSWRCNDMKCKVSGLDKVVDWVD